MRGRRASDGATTPHRPAASAARGLRLPPPSQFIVVVGVRMDEELHLKWSSGSAAWGFDSSPYRHLGTVAKQPKAAVRKTVNRRCESGSCLQPRGVMQRGTLLRSKSGFDSRRGFRFWGRGETGSRDARIVQSRGRHPAAPPLESYPQTWYVPSWHRFIGGVTPRSLPSPGTRSGEGGGRWLPDDVGSTPTSAALSLRGETAITARFERASPGSIPGEGSNSRPGGVTAACLSYKEKDLVRFKAGEPFLG